MMPDQDIVELHSGQFVWYVKAGNAVPLPAVLLSEGICETKKVARGLLQYAHLKHGTANPAHELLGFPSAPIKRGDPDDAARAVGERQTHEVTAPWDPTGSPGTWHLEGEAPELAHPERYNAKPSVMGAPVFQQRPKTAAAQGQPRPEMKGPDD
jgi:hypothetical protein